MGTPVIPPVTPVLMICGATRLRQQCQSGRLPDVLPGAPFWASSLDAPVLAASGQASYPPANYAGPVPPPEPPWTANGIAGFAAGTTNASH